MRHDAVIGGDDQDDDVRHLGAAGAHGGEGFVTRRVQEGDLAAVDGHLIGTGALRDAACFAVGHVGVADAVEQRRFAVVHMTQDGHDGRARHQVIGLFRVATRLTKDWAVFGSFRLVGRFVLVRLFGFGPFDGDAQFFAQDDRGVVVDVVGDGGHNPVLHEHLDQVDGTAVHQLGKVAHGNGVGDDD